MSDIRLKPGESPVAAFLSEELREQYAFPDGKRSLRFPLPKPTLDLVRRTDSWKQNGKFDRISYTFDGAADAPENLFLAFYRLAPQQPEPKKGDYGGHESAYLQALAERWKSDAPWNKLAGEVAMRQHNLLRGLSDDGWHVPPPIDLVTDARLIAGLGYDGPLEVGFSIHPLYGFPYLPASSLKGVARAYAELVLKPKQDVTEADITAIFGSPEKKPERAKEFRVGCVRFFDACPTAFPELVVDVLTPHFSDYYMKGDVPGDWHQPVPTPFLAVAEGQPFRFHLAARADSPGGEITEAQASLYLKQAAEWLEAGLKELGAGGKTAAGYGYFDTSTERKAKKARLRDLKEEMLARDKKAKTQALADAATAKVERQARQRAEREERERREEEQRIEEENAMRDALEPVPDGWLAGVVKSLRPARERGNIDLEDGTEPVPFRFSDAQKGADAIGEEGINEAAFVLFELVQENNQRRAVNVRLRKDTRRAP